MVETAFNALFAALAAGLIVAFVLLTRYVKYLQAQQPAVFEDLGRPSLFTNNSPRHNLRLIRYILSNRCLETGDPTLVDQTRTLRFLLKFYAGCCALLILLVILITTNRGLS